ALPDSIGIKLDHVSGVFVENCTVTGFSQGIALQNSDSDFILNNLVVGNKLDGIDLNFSNNNVFKGNTVSGNGQDGIDLEDSRSKRLGGGICVTGNLEAGISLQRFFDNKFIPVLSLLEGPNVVVCGNGGFMQPTTPPAPNLVADMESLSSTEFRGVNVGITS